MSQAEATYQKKELRSGATAPRSISDPAQCCHWPSPYDPLAVLMPVLPTGGISADIDASSDDVYSWICAEYCGSESSTGAPVWLGRNSDPKPFQEWFLANRKETIRDACLAASCVFVAGAIRYGIDPVYSEMIDPEALAPVLVARGFVAAHIIEPEVKATLIFATETEKRNFCSSLSLLRGALRDDESAASFLADSNSADVVRETAMNCLIGSAGTTFAEVMDSGFYEDGRLVCDPCEYDDFERDTLNFRLSVREEVEAHQGLDGEAPGALVVLAQISPSGLSTILKANIVHIDSRAVLGICDPWGVGGSRLGVALPEYGADLPTNMLASIQIEGTANPANIGEIYEMSPHAWRRCLSPAQKMPLVPDAANFLALVEKRRAQRECATQTEEVRNEILSMSPGF